MSKSDSRSNPTQSAPVEDPAVNRACSSQFIRAFAHDLRTGLANSIGLISLLFDCVERRREDWKQHAVVFKRSELRKGLGAQRDFRDSSASINLLTALEGQLLATLALLEEMLAGGASSFDTLHSAIEQVRCILPMPAHVKLITRDIVAGISCPTLPLVRILLNLLSNSLRHNRRADPIIELVAYTLVENCILIVSDNGPGIDRSIIESLTEPLPNDYKEAHGLGLKIVWDQVRLIGGKITADSSPLGGTRFTIIFPMPLFPKPTSPSRSATTPNSRMQK